MIKPRVGIRSSSVSVSVSVSVGTHLLIVLGSIPIVTNPPIADLTNASQIFKRLEKDYLTVAVGKSRLGLIPMIVVVLAAVFRALMFWRVSQENTDYILTTICFCVEGLALFYLLTLISGEFSDDRSRWEMFAKLSQDSTSPWTLELDSTAHVRAWIAVRTFIKDFKGTHCWMRCLQARHVCRSI